MSGGTQPASGAGATKAPGGPERGQAFPVGSLVVLREQARYGGRWQGPLEIYAINGCVWARNTVGRAGLFLQDELVPYTGPSIPTKLKACAALLLKGEVHGLGDGARRLGWDSEPLFRALGDWWSREWAHASYEELATFLLFCAEALREEATTT